MNQRSVASDQAAAATGSCDSHTRGRLDAAAEKAPGERHEAEQMSPAWITRRWVGGCVGHVYHAANGRLVGGCTGFIYSF
jgi:hypothetical protein